MSRLLDTTQRDGVRGSIYFRAFGNFGLPPWGFYASCTSRTGVSHGKLLGVDYALVSRTIELHSTVGESTEAAP